MYSTYGLYGPVHPGVPPVEPVFPHAEARAALDAINDLGVAINSLSTTRSAAAADALTGASGTSIDAFRERFDRTDTAIRSFWASRGSALVRDHEWLTRAIADAEAAHDAWVAQRAAYDRQLTWHQDWVAANPGVDPMHGPR